MNHRTKKSAMKNWLSAIAVTLVVFYLMNHGIMAMQGLPLNIDMTPVQ
jgi:hypothetical protein